MKPLPSIVVAVALMALTQLSTFAQTQHKIFVAGPTFTGVLDEAGQAVWNSDRPGARDGFVLPSGNFLIAWQKDVQELTPDKKSVFSYALSSGNSEIGTVQRLPNGNTLITELGNKPQLLEIRPSGEIDVRIDLKPETDNAHMQTRMARKLPNGNYLVPHLLAFKVKEYDKSGSVISEIATDRAELGGRAAETWPFTAIRLENDNTLITLTHGNKVIEVDATGKIVWSLTNDDLSEKPLVDPCGAQRLPNGNTVIASYGAQSGIKVFEVDRAKKLIWKYAGPHRAHEIQVLTTDGQAIAWPPMK